MGAMGEVSSEDFLLAFVNQKTRKQNISSTKCQKKILKIKFEIISNLDLLFFVNEQSLQLNSAQIHLRQDSTITTVF